MFGDTECCTDANCGCRIDIYSTDRKCPVCGRRLRLSGRAQVLEFRLSCSNCGYQSSLLSQEKLRELI